MWECSPVCYAFIELYFEATKQCWECQRHGRGFVEGNTLAGGWMVTVWGVWQDVNRRLREEQDQAYQQSLKEDQERERQRAAQREKQAAAERAAAEAAAAAKLVADLLSPACIIPCCEPPSCQG